MKLYTKLILSILGVTLLSSVLLGFSMYYSAYDILQRSISQTQLDIAHHQMDSIDRALFGAYQGIQIIANNPRIESFFKTIDSKLVDDSMKPVFPEEIMEKEMRLTGPWDILFFVDKTGRIFFSDNKAEEGRHINNEPLSKIAYDAAMQGKVYYSDWLISEDTGKPTIIFAAPVYDDQQPNHPISGVVIGNFTWLVIMQQLNEINPLNDVHLFNWKGDIIASPIHHKQHILQENIIGDELIKQAIQGRTYGSAIVPSSWEEGGDILASYSKQHGFLSYRGHDWGLLIELPTETAFAPVHLMTRQLIAILLGMAAIIIALVSVLGRRAIQPLEQLTSSAQAVGNGNLEQRIDIDRQDEIGILATSFNDMVKNLKATTVSKEYMDNIFQSMNDILIILNTDATIRSINPAALKLFDYTEQELAGHPVREIIQDDDDIFLADNWIEVLVKKAGIHGTEGVCLTKNGTLIPVLFSISVMDGKSVGGGSIIYVAQNCTEQKRTLDALMKAKVQAEAANDAKTIFLSRMSHELRTPLNAILGFSKLMQQSLSVDIDEQKEFSGYILKAGEHLLLLINDTLDLVTIEQNKMKISLENCKLSQIIDESLVLVQKQASNRNVLIENEPTTLFAMANHLRLKQVIINLLSNAIKYNKQGGSVRIEVKAVAQEEVEILVTDTGIGISPNDQQVIFQPFTRLAYAEQHEIQGTGIGLALTKFLVEEMHGRIDLESQPGEGSVFRLRFHKGKDPEANTSLPVRESIAMTKDTLTRCILYIEDNSASRKLMKAILRPYPNINLLMADTAEEGIRLANENIPDLIILDINLPEMNGISALKVLNTNPALGKTKMIALSADAMPHQIKLAMDGGFDQYLTKPFNLKEIISLIEGI
tara:strand:- start:5761 stop:8397 length:2637 start_codon:yes stop_codon:yes gene_type:complete